jgi:hypothetical protein
VGLANDEWIWLTFLVGPGDPHFSPYNQQPVAGPVFLYRLWTETVGVDHRFPLTFTFGLLHVAVCGALYALARRRVGPWLAAALAILALFLGRAWETLLFPPSLTFVLPALGLCVTWLVLDRDRGPLERVAATGLLVLVALSSGGIVAVLVGLTAEIAASRKWRRLWMVAIPAAAHLVWRLDQSAFGERRGSEPGVDLSANLQAIPVWTGKQLASVTGAAVGLGPKVGLVLLVLGSAALARWWWRARPQPSPRLVGLVVTLLATPVLIGIGRAADTPPTSSRYLYVGAIVLLAFVAELAGLIGPPRRRRAAAIAVGVGVVLAVLLGVQQLRDGKVFYLRAADGTASRLGALHLAAERAPDYLAFREPTRLQFSLETMGWFLDRYGDGPLYTERQLLGALPESRAAADKVLADGLVSPATRAPEGCGAFSATRAERALPARDVVLVARATGPVGELMLRRFAPPGAGVRFRLDRRTRRLALRVRDDRGSRPWQVSASGASIMRCR